MYLNSFFFVDGRGGNNKFCTRSFALVIKCWITAMLSGERKMKKKKMKLPRTPNGSASLSDKYGEILPVPTEHDGSGDAKRRHLARPHADLLGSSEESDVMSDGPGDIVDPTDFKPFDWQIIFSSETLPCNASCIGAFTRVFKRFMTFLQQTVAYPEAQYIACHIELICLALFGTKGCQSQSQGLTPFGWVYGPLPYVLMKQQCRPVGGGSNQSCWAATYPPRSHRINGPRWSLGISADDPPAQSWICQVNLLQVLQLFLRFLTWLFAGGPSIKSLYPL